MVHFTTFSIIFWVRIMVFNATFDNISAISWRTVLLGEETGVRGEIVTLQQQAN